MRQPVRLASLIASSSTAAAFSFALLLFVTACSLPTGSTSTTGSSSGGTTSSSGTTSTGGTSSNGGTISPSNMVWVSGSDQLNQSGVYGTEGTASTSNIPGARYDATTWVDGSGNLWLFGGYGYDSVGTQGYLSDLWEYQPSTNEWTWVSGSKVADQNGSYGTKLTGSTSNVPGARAAAAGWIDSSGNLWLFGGNGYDSAGTSGFLGDLWEYQPSTKQWTWVSGSNLANQVGSYGTQGTGSTSTVPGSRDLDVGWIDPSGNFWIFGGWGYDSTGAAGSLNDLWEYQPSTKQWTWVSGSNVACQDGSYGTQGTPSSSNFPGSRNGATGWVGSSGNLWLFGGQGYDSVGTSNGTTDLNDLWEFQPSTKQWTWISGSDIGGAKGVYGTEGTASPSNMPGGRYSMTTMVDSSGNVWVFGGFGVDSQGGIGALNDLWEYQPSNNEWTWIAGSDVAGNTYGTYGTEGTASSINAPGDRWGAGGWIDSSGNFWLFGGQGLAASGSVGYLNDLWEF